MFLVALLGRIREPGLWNNGVKIVVDIIDVCTNNEDNWKTRCFCGKYLVQSSVFSVKMPSVWFICLLLHHLPISTFLKVFTTRFALQLDKTYVESIMLLEYSNSLHILSLSMPNIVDGVVFRRFSNQAACLLQESTYDNCQWMFVFPSHECLMYNWWFSTYFGGCILSYSSLLFPYICVCCNRSEAQVIFRF